MQKVLSLVGARPQFIKEALVGSAAQKRQAWHHILVHSGQHYDDNMSQIFFDDLDVTRPSYNLGIGSGSHGAMTAAALDAMEKVLCVEQPDALLLYGDTNTTLAGALAAAKLGIPIIHVEAGIRMLPRTMPEEINRVLTDRIATVMCCCSELGRQNLAAEGIKEGVHITGDVMLDLFERVRPKLTPSDVCAVHGLTPDGFVLATLHRDYNVDTPESLRGIVEGLLALQDASNTRVFWPIHPRTRKKLDEFGLTSLAHGLKLAQPLGYLDMMALLCVCEFVISDSGGLQKEAYYAHKRCLVVMPDTGWRELCMSGWNLLAAPDANMLEEKAYQLRVPVTYPPNLYGDGYAAERIVDAVLQHI